MNFNRTKFKEVIVVEPIVHGDHRGWFFESYSNDFFMKEDLNILFIQDNHSFSASKGTLRGLHYQLNPKAQTKLVRCTKGAIYDVAVDIRKGSPTYGDWIGVELSEENKKQLLVPRGFAHGFITMTDDVEVQYKVDEVYSPEHDRGIIWNDPRIAINWPLDVKPVTSLKDEQAPLLKDAENTFIFGDKI